MKRKTKIWVLAGIALLILVVSGVAIASSRDRGTEVRSEVVAQRDLIEAVSASGVIQPKRKVDISADISGRVIQLSVEEGQLVNQGDLLLRIDPTSYQAAVRRAEAAVAQAQAQASQARANVLQSQSAARRAEQLSAGEGLISPQDVEQARTAQQVAEAQFEAARFGVAQTQASLSEAREALRKTTILAPMSGRVTRLNIQEGETAIVGTMNNPGSLLLTIADLSVMEASVRVDETDLPRISYGDSASIRIDAFPNRTFSGRVTRISNSAIQGLAGASSGQAQSVDFEVVITLDDPPEGLRPDLSATGEIVTARRFNAISVPIISVTVRDREGKRFRSNVEPGAPAAAQGEAAEEIEGVFVIRDGTIEFVPVTIGIAGDRYFEIESGLSGGELVVAGPYAAIRDLEGGAQVRVSSQAEPAGGAEANP
ncbi:MAG: efflux RND transporter periplasmic adaptor subunit [Gemmatimonadetes bacterium]|nr:efflux RND transporter periplasmic adaptor subunit [Gemmatimonadota bacterium]